MLIQKTTLIRRAFFIGVLFLIFAQGFAAEKGEQMKNNPIRIKTGESFLLKKDQAAEYKGILFTFSAVTHPFSENPDTRIEQYPQDEYQLTVSYLGTEIKTYKIGDGSFLRGADPSDQPIKKVGMTTYTFRILEHKTGEVRLILNQREAEEQQETPINPKEASYLLVISGAYVDFNISIDGKSVSSVSWKDGSYSSDFLINKYLSYEMSNVPEGKIVLPEMYGHNKVEINSIKSFSDKAQLHIKIIDKLKHGSAYYDKNIDLKSDNNNVQIDLRIEHDTVLVFQS